MLFVVIYVGNYYKQMDNELLNIFECCQSIHFDSFFN